MKLKYKNWQDISINVFDKLKGINSNIKDEIDVIDSNAELLSILCDCSVDDILNLSTSDFSKLLNESDFIKYMPKVDIKDKYTLNGKKYELFLSMKKITVAQYIDFQTYIKDREKYFKELLSVFIIPKGKKYNEDYDVAEVIEDIGNYLSVVDANSIMFFFVLLYQSLTKVILNYLIKTLKKNKKMTQAEREKIEKAIIELRKAQDSFKNGNGFI